MEEKLGELAGRAGMLGVGWLAGRAGIVGGGLAGLAGW